MSSSNKRERELARAKYERQQQRRAQRQTSTRRRTQIIAAVAAIVVVGGGVTALLLSSRDSGTPVASPSSTPSPSSTVSCSPAPEPTVKTATWPKADTTKLKKDSTYFVKLDTNCGAIDIQIDADAPKTAASMIFLANAGYYTNSDCFRLTTSDLFVLQCGSPTNDGKGGPGYTLPDENLPADTIYPAGTVAMANAGSGTAGSQFFIVYKDTTLDPAIYTVWGTVVSGLDVVTKVAAAGVQGGGADGAPAQPIVITKATTRETSQVG